MKKAHLILNILNIIGFSWLLVRLLFNNSLGPYIWKYGGFYLFFTTWVIEFVWEKKWQNWHWNSTTAYFVLMIVFFLLSIAYAPFDSRVYFKHHLEMRYSLLGFGVVGMFGLNRYYKLSYCFNLMTIVSILAVAFLIFFKVGFGEFVTSPDRALLFTEARIASVNSHMGFNFYLNMSLVGIWFICTHMWQRLPRWSRYAYGTSVLIIFYILSLSEGRSGFLASIILMSCFVIREIWRRRKKLGLLAVLLFPLVIYTISQQHPRMSSETLQNEPRIILWQSAVELIEEKPVLGYGMSRAQEAFDKVNLKYASPEYKQYYQDINPYFIDTHNQYLQTTLEFGIFGLLFLLILYAAPIFIVAKPRRILAVFICGLCVYQSVFDMFITGQFCPIFCMLMLLLLRIPNDVRSENVSKKQ